MSVPKTKSSIRKLVLPPAVVQVLKEYRESVHSRWMFPSPVLEDLPLNPGSVYDRLQLISGARKLQTGAFSRPQTHIRDVGAAKWDGRENALRHAGACVGGHDAGYLHALDL